MTKGGDAGAGAADPAAASLPPSTKKRPASPPPAAKKPHHHAEKEGHAHSPHPLHDDRLPVDVVEEGRIFFFYRPRVAPASADTSRAVKDVSGIAKTYVLLAPLAASDKNVGEGRAALAEAEERDPSHGRPLNRIFVVPRKTLPGRSGEPRLAICAKVGASVGELTKGLEASTYETKTRGERQQPAARLVARGAYMIVAPTSGALARAAHKAQQKRKEEEEEAAAGEEQKKKKPRRATPGEKAAEAARAARHGRPVNSARLLWLLEAPRHDGPAQQMLSIEHRGAFVIKVKGPLGGAGGGAGGGGWAPPPPKLEDLPEPAAARLAAAHTKWVDVDSHAALDFKGAQLLMIGQYGAGGSAGGPGSLEAGGIKQDRAAMAEEAGPETAAALADLVAEGERALKDDARAHGEPARGELGAALRRAMLRELSAGAGGGGEDEGDEEGDDWATAHHEEAEAQLRLHERQEAEEEGEGEGGQGGEGEGAGGLVVDPAITGEIV